MKKKNLIGQKFHRLLVIAEAPSKIQGKENRKRTAWLCQCDCGNTKIVGSDHLQRKDARSAIKSCGCLDIENYPKRAKDMRDKNTKFHPSISTARRVFRSNQYRDGDLTFEDFYRLSQLPCYYCGAKPSNITNSAKHDSKKSSQYAKDNGDFYYNGLDRIDSSRKHFLDNVVPCCKWCNYAKNNRTMEDFKAWVKGLYDHLFIQKEKDSSCLESFSELIQSESLLGSDDHALSTSGNTSWVNNGDTDNFANNPTQF